MKPAAAMSNDRLTPETAAPPVAEGSSEEEVDVSSIGTVTSVVVETTVVSAGVEMVLLALTKVEVGV